MSDEQTLYIFPLLGSMEIESCLQKRALGEP